MSKIEPFSIECEFCLDVSDPAPRAGKYLPKKYSINTTETYRLYALKYMRTHVLKYHKAAARRKLLE